jgi:hypothetical protein
MSAPAVAGVVGPTVRIRGTPYPVVLPTLRDPRLHLAAVIVSLQVLGQVAFEFRLSIAQILVSLLTCAVLEAAIAFRRQRVFLWPASALLTGNGVAFILRVPGTEHGDWWSMRGWWIFAGTAGVALLSKHLVRLRGHHLFNPSNAGLVLCFLVLGAGRAEPLDFWWAPMSGWMALALAIIVAGGLGILARLRLLAIAVGFWLAFAAGIGVLAASGHEMTARWHLGPITGWDFWWALVSSPEILVFLFFMITDPKTIPDGRLARRVYATGVGLLAALLIAPLTTEYATKVAVLGALAIVCAARPLVEWLAPAAGPSPVRLRTGSVRRAPAGALALAAAAGFAGILVLAGLPNRSTTGTPVAPLQDVGVLPQVTVVESRHVASRIDGRMAQQIARHVVSDLHTVREALRRRSAARASTAATGTWLDELLGQIRGAAGGGIVVPAYSLERMRLSLEPADDQEPAIIMARLEGAVALETYGRSPSTVEHREDPTRFAQTLELVLEGSRYKIRRVVGAQAAVAAGARPAVTAALGGVELRDVAVQAGLDFRQDAFRFGVSRDVTAMMGGGLCWLDYDGDGWLDLFVVNSYSELDKGISQTRVALPRSALFHNVGGRFEDVSRRSRADLQVRGNGCVAADLNGDGHTDLYVTTAGYNVATDGYDALLWNNGDGTFAEGARAAGINTPGWHAGVAAADVNGDGRTDLFVAGYTDPSSPLPGSARGFPANHAAVRDRLYLNVGPDGRGRSRFREVGPAAGIEAARIDHGLGAVFTDVDGDGRPDLYVANDLDPNRLYVNVAWPGGRSADPAGLGFRLEERGRSEGVADPNAGMGIAAADYTADGRPDLFVTNSRGQLHAAFRSRVPGRGGPSFADARSVFAPALGTRFTAWGASWADLDRDGSLDLVLANGAIPVTNLVRNAQAVKVLTRGETGAFGDASSRARLGQSPRVNGRGVAAADYDNDGDLDVAVNSIAGRLLLLQNTGATGHWLEVALPTFSPGAVVTAVLPDGRRLVREVQAGSSYLSSEDPRLHFGLGDATTVSELRVRYAGGGETLLTDVAADRLVVARRG